ncbi:MAG TPA: amino acid adenylation domain-containing protein, partial [Longimicrobium sp.]|nr:amino acid adenylation domain-containing protein [Longimicrobium sp.]
MSGEAVSSALVRQFHQRLPGVELTNQYGPTESGEVTEWACDPEAERVSIGRAIHNSAVYVLDRAGEPAPVGAAGELFIGGVAVARGYLGRPRLTAERFVPDPFGEPGARLYRTGDLCRWLPDGTLEYLGRTDFQVKVRGFRVEPGEIEARLASHPGVREAVVLALDDGAGGKRLVAYFVGEALESEALRAHLSQQLPEYMVPAAFVRLETLPLTPNGKLDRRALPAPDADAFAARAYEAPVGEVENVLAGIWSELLGVERVSRGDHFFALGGHSLLAVRVVSRVRRALGVDASLGDLFERPVLADLARGLETATAEGTAIVPVERGGPVPLSFAQQRLWFLEQLGNLGSTYHIPMGLRLRGDLDRGALVRSLDRIVARHEALRTSFPVMDGEPVQRIAPVEESAFRLVEHDLHAAPDAEDELRRLMRDEATAPFDLEQGPLARGRLVRLAADDHVLLLTMHHIVSDGWSVGVLYRELGALYAAFVHGQGDPLPPLPVQYADYAVWHRRWVEGPVLEAQAEYWLATLAGAPELLELPTDHPRPAKQDFAGSTVNVELDEVLTAALKTLSQRHGTTLFMTLLAGWATVLSRLSGQHDVVVGTPSANRGRSEIEGLIGFFVNMLPVRVDLSGAPAVAEALGRVKARALEAQANQDIPFEQVVERVRPSRSLSHTPLFQVMFAWQNAPEGSPELPELALDPLDPLDLAGSGGSPPQVSAKFDFSLALHEDGGRIEGVVEYATALFERETVQRYVGYLRRVLEGMAADDALQAVDALPLLSETERRLLVEAWGRTEAASPPEGCIHELFEAQARRTPEAVAVVHGDEALTYAELDARANRLARRLVALGAGPEVRVGICLERSAGMVVALLAALKAGGVYVPLDLAYPADRLAYMLADSGARVLVTQASLSALLPAEGVRTVLVDADAAEVAAEPDAAPRTAVAPENAAYVIYTSGSTGRPKGVVVTHGNAANLLPRAVRTLGAAPGTAVLQATSTSFDASLLEVFVALLSGAALHLADREVVLAPERLAALLREREVGVWVSTPALLGSLLETDFPALRTISTGGERCSAETAARWSRGRRLLNMYGPTETTIYTTAHECAPGGVEAPPIGRPVEGTRAYVLDAWGEPAPVGVAGELYVGGAGVARGYLERSALT